MNLTALSDDELAEAERILREPGISSKAWVVAQALLVTIRDARAQSERDGERLAAFEKLATAVRHVENSLFAFGKVTPGLWADVKAALAATRSAPRSPPGHEMCSL